MINNTSWSFQVVDHKPSITLSLRSVACLTLNHRRFVVSKRKATMLRFCKQKPMCFSYSRNFRYRLVHPHRWLQTLLSIMFPTSLHESYRSGEDITISWPLLRAPKSFSRSFLELFHYHTCRYLLKCAAIFEYKACVYRKWFTDKGQIRIFWRWSWNIEGVSSWQSKF